MSKFNYIYSDPTESALAIGSTPYGIYDADTTFASESIQVCKWVARRLGHPVMQLEFDSGSIYAMFEESISEYSSHINNYNTKNWMWNSYGADNKQSGSILGSTGSFETQHGHLGTTWILSEQYGESVNVGGSLTLHSGSIVLTGSKQTYDLQSEAVVTGSHTNKRLEIQRVFNYGPSSITRFYDPFAGSFDQRSMLDGFGMGSASPAVSFVMRPISYDISRAQAIETNDKVRKSAYSFELVDNKLRIFPRPVDNDAGDKIYFQYYVKDEKGTTTRSHTSNKVSDPSNVPYKFLTYSHINSSGRQWIRKMTLALSKELLGIIRSKYSSMPLPNGEVTMDGEGLKAEGREEKTQLLDELKEFLETVSLTEKAKSEAEEAEANRQVLAHSPLGIYIGSFIPLLFIDWSNFIW
ncbi:MAG: hypothetical protein H8D94_00595 [Candidatus Pelagibacter sp.]|nr:hypothetical protein [Candidatus Pelagibacter sp.]